MMANRNAEEIAISVQSELRDAVAIAIERFRVEADERELNFPSSFTTVERAYIHRVARALGYVSRSRGRGAQRAVTIYKVSIANLLANRATFELSHNSRLVIAQLLDTCPVQPRERADLQPRTERDQPSAVTRGEMQKTITARLNSGVAQVPERRAAATADGVPLELRYATLYAKRTELLKLINEARCVLVTGEPGLGKSTQISQLIMDDAAVTGRACRLIQAVPYRALAMRLAERVAADRGENVVGNAVGYQVRLASRVSPCTVLTFCTNGVLLRTMMNAPAPGGTPQQALSTNDGGGALCTATHIVVDELQVRDRFGDFALACLRDFVNKYRNVKLVLITAPCVNSQAIVTYFNNTQCHLVQLAKRPSSVAIRELFLDGVLSQLAYCPPPMRVAAAQIATLRRRSLALQSWLKLQTGDKTQQPQAAADKVRQLDTSATDAQPLSGADAELDLLILHVFCGDYTAIDRFYVILATRLGYPPPASDELYWPSSVPTPSPTTKGEWDVDYAHSTTGVTMLHAACANGWLRDVQYLLNMGANLFVRAANGWTALDFASRFEQHAVADLLEAHASGCSALLNDEYDSATVANLSDDRVVSGFEQLAGEGGTLTGELAVLAYQRVLGPFVRIDYDLIISLLRHIDAINSSRRTTLVFLPSVDEISSLRNRLLGERFVVCVAHETMQPGELKALFDEETLSDAARPAKVVLTSELAESCVTLPHVGFVVDTGVNLERAFQPMADFTYMRYAFVSKADAIMRKQRLADGYAPVEGDASASGSADSAAKQPTIFRLYSRRRFDKLRPQRAAALLRSNLLDVGLYTKLLAPTNFPIADFLAKTLDAPLFAASRNAVHALKQLDALDSFEELTELGYHLLDLPLDARYAKMIVMSVVLKCVDPVLTVACFLGVRNPFLDEAWNTYLYAPDDAPSQLHSDTAQNECEKALRRRYVKNTFAAQSNSDHMILLRAFQLWQKAKEEGNEQRFCADNMLSPSALELVLVRRAQVLQQLRASGFVRARSNGDLRDLNANSENWAVVKAALVAACYPQLVRLDRTRYQLLTAQHADVRFAPSSAFASLPFDVSEQPPNAGVTFASRDNTHELMLYRLPSDWLLYDQLSHATGVGAPSKPGAGAGAGTSANATLADAAKRPPNALQPPLCAAKPRQFAIAHCCTVVSAVTVALFAGPSRLAAFEKLLADSDAEAQGELQPAAFVDEPEVADPTDGDADSSSLFEDDDVASIAASFMQARAAGAQLTGGRNEPNAPRRRRSVVLHVDDLVRFELDADVGRLIAQLRAKWQSLLIRRLRAPNRPCSAADDAVLHALVAVLTSEEQASGLQQPSGIGQRPRPSATVLNASTPFATDSFANRPRSGSFGTVAATRSAEMRRGSDDDAVAEFAYAAHAQSGSPHGSSASNSSGDLLGDTLVAPSTQHSAVNAAEFVPQHLARPQQRAAAAAAAQHYLAAGARTQPPVSNAAMTQQAALTTAVLRQQTAAAQQRAAASFAPTPDQQRMAAAQQAASMPRASAATGASQSQSQMQPQVYYAMLAALRGQAHAQAQAQAQAQLQAQAQAEAQASSAAASADIGSGIRYFVLKGADASLLDTSADTGVWPVEPNTARKLRLCARESRGVCLVFMLQSSGVFYGYATLVEPPGSPPPLSVAQALELRECPPAFACFVHYELLHVDWLLAGVRLPFNATHQLAISATDNRKVYLAKDGQEIDSSVGNTLVQLINFCAAATNQQHAATLGGLQQPVQANAQSQFAQLGLTAAQRHAAAAAAAASLIGPTQAHSNTQHGGQPNQADFAMLAGAMHNLDVNEQFFADAMTGMPQSGGANAAEFASATNVNSFGLGMGVPFSGAALRPTGTGNFPRPTGAPGSSAFRTVDQSSFGPFGQQAAYRANQPYANLGGNWQRMPF